jgi:hypothetical protein
MRLPYNREARWSRSPTEEFLVQTSDLFTLTLGSLALAVAVSSRPPLPLPALASSLPAPGR